MKRQIKALTIVCLWTALLVTLAGQGDKRLRIKYHPGQITPPPPVEQILITDPANDLTTTAASIPVSGTYTGGITTCCTWGNALTSGGGSTTGASGVYSIAVASSNKLFQDAFTESASVALATHTPTDVGTSWSVFLNTSTVTINASSNDYAGANTTDNTDGHVALLEANLATPISGNDYVAALKFPTGFYSLQTSTQAVGFIFGMSGTNFCSAYILGTSTATMATNLAGVGTKVGTDATVTAAAGQTWTLTRASNVYTLSQDGVVRDTFTDTGGDCAAKRVGAGWGALRTGQSTDIRTGNGIDDFTVVDPNAGGTSGVPLNIGVNTITITGSELGGTMHTATRIITRVASDTTPPTGTFTGPSTSSPYSTTNRVITFTGTYGDNIATDTIVVDCGMTTSPTMISASFSPNSPGSASGTWSAGPFTMPAAPSMTTCTLTVTDTAMLSSTATMRVDEITGLDVTAPTCTITGPTSSSTYTTNVATLQIIAGCTDDVGVITPVTYTSDNCGSGNMSGTNPASATLTLTRDCTITVHGFDAAGHEGTDSIVITYSVPVNILTTSLPGGVQSSTYTNQTLTAEGGTGTYTWDNGTGGGTTLGTGACSGLTITDSGNVGVVGGTPTTSGTCNTSVRVCDSMSVCDTQSYSFAIATSGSTTLKWLDNSYYNSVCAPGGTYNSYMFKCYDLRGTNPSPATYDTEFYTYSPDTDSLSEKHDGTQIRIPGWVGSGATFLTTALTSASSGTIEQVHLNQAISYMKNGVAIKIGTEIMMCVPPVEGGNCIGSGGNTQNFWVYRGAFSTTAAAHSTGAVVQVNENSIGSNINKISLSIANDTSSTNSYLFSWDVYWPTEWAGQSQPARGCAVNLPLYTIVNHGPNACGIARVSYKQWQFELGGGVAYETRSAFTGSTNPTSTCCMPTNWSTTAVVNRIAAVDLRTYVGGAMGEGGTDPTYDLDGNNGGFIIEPGKTIRYWELFEATSPADPSSFIDASVTLSAAVTDTTGTTMSFAQPVIGLNSTQRLIGSSNKPAFGRAVKIDSEIVTIESCSVGTYTSSALTCTVKRNQYGSTAATHSSGASVLPNTDWLSIWVADTDTDPVLLFGHIATTFGYDTKTHQKLTLGPMVFEWNSSQDVVAQGQIDNGFADLHAYVRNFWGIRMSGLTNGMPSAWSGLLVKPTEN